MATIISSCARPSLQTARQLRLSRAPLQTCSKTLGLSYFLMLTPLSTKCRYRWSGYSTIGILMKGFLWPWHLILMVQRESTTIRMAECTPTLALLLHNEALSRRISSARGMNVQMTLGIQAAHRGRSPGFTNSLLSAPTFGTTTTRTLGSCHAVRPTESRIKECVQVYS